MANEALIKAKVEARNAADQLADLYISESVRIKNQHGEHGLEASIAFFERLRDNLIAIRPLSHPEQVKPQPASRKPKREPFVADECPDGYEEVELGEEVRSETDLAILIGYQWFPKSVLHGVPSVGDYVDSLAVKSWFVEKELG